MSDHYREPIPVARFDYELPPELIAQEPIEQRDAARLLVVDRATSALSDHTFAELPQLLRAGDLLVLNDTRVFPARLRTRRASGGNIELLFLHRAQRGVWRVLARPARRLRVGEALTVLDRSGCETTERVHVVDRDGDGASVRIDDEAIVGRYGVTPLPPYIRTPLADPERYQTVYAAVEGSAAAPTAGLHFTERVLNACREHGVDIATLTLHVGLDTFQPIRVDDARAHAMHSEWFEVSSTTLAMLRATRERGGRVVGVGTTVVRTLESLPDDALSGEIAGRRSGWTRLYITPGFEFRVVDGMLTNFHLPRTTLMLLVSAMAGEEAIRRAYAHAIAQRYRFYSFGDAMLML